MTSLLTAKRLVLSTVITLISSNAIVSTAHALPKIDPSFNLLELRQREQDIRNGLVVLEEETAEKPSYEAETTYQPAEDAWQPEEEAQEQLSTAERRRQSAERRNK